MKPHPRIRRTIIFSSAAILLLSSALWIASAYSTIRWCPSRDKLMLYCSGGAFQMWYVRGRPWSAGSGFSIDPPSGPWVTTSTYGYHSPAFDYIILPFWTFVPLTIPPILIALFFERIARRRAVIVSGTCPDCRAPRDRTTPSALCPSCCADPIWGRRSFPRLRRTFKWLAPPAAALLIALWIASSSWVLSYRSASGTLHITTTRGGASIEQGGVPVFWRARPTGFSIGKTYAHPYFPDPHFPAPHYSRSMGMLSILLPFWLPTIPLTLAGLTAWILDPISTRRERARHRTHCINCRYPLTGLPPGAKCPECGTPIPT
jgi:hypothetical protein